MSLPTAELPRASRGPSGRQQPCHRPRSTPSSRSSGGRRPKRSRTGSPQPWSPPGGGEPPGSPSAAAALSPALPPGDGSAGLSREVLAGCLFRRRAAGLGRPGDMALYNFKKITVVPSAKVMASLPLRRPSARGEPLPRGGGSLVPRVRRALPAPRCRRGLGLRRLPLPRDAWDRPGLMLLGPAACTMRGGCGWVWGWGFLSERGTAA